MKMVSSMLILFLCVGSAQAGAGSFLKPLSATPENEKEAVTHLTEKKEEAAEEVQAAADSKAADAKDAADSAEEVKADEKDAADSKALSELEAVAEKLDAKAEELNNAAEKDGASAEAKKAAEQADKDYQAADKKFAEADQKLTEAMEAKDEEGNEAEDNEAEDNDEDSEADEEDMDNEEDEEGTALIQDPPGRVWKSDETTGRMITMAEYRQSEEQVDQDYQDAVANDRCFSLATADYRERCKDEREEKEDLKEKQAQQKDEVSKGKKGKVALLQDPPSLPWKSDVTTGRMLSKKEFLDEEEQIEQDYQAAVANDRCDNLPTADYRERCKDEREKKMDLDEKLMESRKAELKLLKRRKSNIAGATKTMSMER